MKKQLEKKRYETPELFVDAYAADTMIASTEEQPCLTMGCTDDTGNGGLDIQDPPY